MYVRNIQRKNKDGSMMEYVQLAHNAWNSGKDFAQAEVVSSFGRKDQPDIEAINPDLAFSLFESGQMHF